MLRFSIAKFARYFAIFILGYASAHFIDERSIFEPETLQPFIASTTTCSTVTPICPTVSAMHTLDSSPAAPELSEARIDHELQNSEIQDGPITDFDSPDEQIKLMLVEASDAFTQTGEQIDQNQDPLAPLFLLAEDQQLGYIQKLVESQEDSAVVALNDLILNDNPPIQTAAINGLISLLEMRTGHFAVIAENLEQNAVFLNEDQLAKLRSATVTAATQ